MFSKLALFAALSFLSLPIQAAAQQQDDVKTYLSAAREQAKTWQPDAELVYLTIGSSIDPDGSNSCATERPTTGWNYAFYSKVANAYYTVYGCKGTVSGEPTGKSFQAPLASISQDFMGTPDVVKILKQVSREWGLYRCQSVQALRADEAAGVPVWSTMLDCGDVGATVVIDAVSGKVLKSRRTS
jgi:hypothetical protein